MNKFLLTLLMVLLPVLAIAESKCLYSYQAKSTSLTFTAFKTEKKVGVTVKLPKFTITPAHKNADSILAAIELAQFKIEPKSLDSGDKARDAKIAGFFFNGMKNGPTITGKVLSISTENNSASVEITMNGVSKTVLMSYIADSETLRMKGTVDIFDFLMNKQLEDLGKACSVKHEGKTWNTVDINLESTFKKKC